MPPLRRSMRLSRSQKRNFEKMVAAERLFIAAKIRAEQANLKMRRLLQTVTEWETRMISIGKELEKYERTMAKRMVPEPKPEPVPGTSRSTEEESKARFLHALDLNCSEHGAQDGHEKSLRATQTCTLGENKNMERTESSKKIPIPQNEKATQAEGLWAQQFLWHPTKEDIEKFLNNPITAEFKPEAICLSLSQVTNEPEFFPQISQYLQSILRQSSSNLRFFGLASPIGFLNNETQFTFPPLPAVTSLSVNSHLHPHSFTSPSPKLIFPIGMKLEAAFPNLNRVTLKLTHLNELDKWEDYFHGDLNPVLSVKVLNFLKTENFSEDWMKGLKNIFPNVEQLSVISQLLDYSDAALTGLWNFRKLKTLNWKIHLPSIINNVSVERAGLALESIFTGFPLRTVLMLRKTGASDLRQLFCSKAKMDELRKNPSILDVRDLKHLRVVFVDNSEEIRVGYPPLLTHITGLFAFWMCPRMERRIGMSVRRENFKPLMNAVRGALPFAKTQPMIQNLVAESNAGPRNQDTETITP